MPLCAIPPVNSSTGITAVSDSWVVIVVDMMKWRGAFQVAPSSHRRKWLWWTSEVLMEAQGITAHLLFLLSSLHKQNTVTQSLHHHHFLLHLISSFHESLSLCNFCLALLHFATGFCAVLIISTWSWLTSPQPLSPSIMLAFQQAPPLTNTPSPPPSQLLSPHPPISLHHGWLLPLQTHLSMHLFLILSLSTTEFPLSFSIHLAPGKQTDATALTPSGNGAVAEVGWSAPLNHFAPQLLVKEATDSVAVDQQDWKSPPPVIYWTQGTKTTLPCDYPLIKETPFLRQCLYSFIALN